MSGMLIPKNIARIVNKTREEQSKFHILCLLDEYIHLYAEDDWIIAWDEYLEAYDSLYQIARDNNIFYDTMILFSAMITPEEEK